MRRAKTRKKKTHRDENEWQNEYEVKLISRA